MLIHIYIYIPNLQKKYNLICFTTKNFYLPLLDSLNKLLMKTLKKKLFNIFKKKIVGENFIFIYIEILAIYVIKKGIQNFLQKKSIQNDLIVDFIKKNNLY